MPSLSNFAAAMALLASANAHTIHSVLVFTRHGDRTAKFYKNYEMTNLGAQQVYSSGQYYRDRYLTGSHPIAGVSQDSATTSQIWASAPDQHVLYQTATNFLQGLYPPLAAEDPDVLGNGTEISGPLDGYQFILVHGEDTTSPDTIWLKGDDSCPAYDSASKAYAASAEYKSTLETSAPFYSKFPSQLGSIMGTDKVNYAHAYDVFDLLNVASIHNRTVVNAPFDYEPFDISPSDLDQLRYYADSYEWHSNYNATNPDRSIGGMALAGGILQQLQSVVDKQAKTKFSLMAGSYDTFLSFFGLTNLTAASADFMGLPGYAASMAFELFTDEEAFNVDELKVRFLFRNGTAEGEVIDAYALFGEKQVDMPWSSFAEKLGGRSINTVQQWCGLCGSEAAFCVAANQISSSPSVANSNSGSGLSNAAAGGIGAAVTLAVVGVVGVALWLARRKKSQASGRKARVVADPEKSVGDSESSRS